MFLYIGSYTEPGMGNGSGIGLTTFDPASGELAPVQSITEAVNPSYLTVSDDGRFLYSVNEIDGGGVTAYARDPESGALRRLNGQQTGGTHPCYLSIDPTGRFLLVVNYNGSNLAVFPLAANGTISPASQILAHEGSSINPNRQQVAHPHMIRSTPDGRFVYVTDLGADKIVRYRLDTDAGALVDPVDTAMTPGMGPRHFAFSNDGKTLVVIGELDSTLVSFAIGDEGELTPVSTVSTLPADFTGESTCAHVLFSPDGRFVYGSNRGHDSIAVASFDAATRQLEIVEIVPTGGKEPRNFTLDPAGNWLVAGNQHTDTVNVFRRDAESGKLTATDNQIESITPIAFQFVG